MTVARTIKVFIASPGDLAAERQEFKIVIDDLNRGFADGAKVSFIGLGWEDTLASTGRRTQAVINQDVDNCDIFVLAMHRRWGQDAPDAKPFASYTEEEFHRALARWRKTTAPEIFVFFKNIDPMSMGDPGPQLTKVLAFRKALADSREVLARPFGDIEEFKNELDRHLRAYVRNELPSPALGSEGIVLPLEYIQEIDRAKAEARRHAEIAEASQRREEAAIARAEEFALETAKIGARAALEGRVEEARQLLARAQQGTTNLGVLYLAYDFYSRTGDFRSAEDMLNRWLAICGSEQESINTAAAIGNLALLYKQKGDLASSERMQNKALKISRKLRHLEGEASALGNLGSIYLARGELERAEQIELRALELETMLGRTEGIANAQGTLAVIFADRGDVGKSEPLLRSALQTFEKLKDESKIATSLANLAKIHLVRGELDEAEHLLKRALAIEEKQAHQEGIARVCSNLGVLLQKKGNLTEANALLHRAVNVYTSLGTPIGLADAQINLGNVQQKLGRLDSAEMLYKVAFKIYQTHNVLSGVSGALISLASIQMANNELSSAENILKEALEIDEASGRSDRIAANHVNLAKLFRKKDDYQSAFDHLTAARQIYARLEQKELSDEVDDMLAVINAGL